MAGLHFVHAPMPMRFPFPAGFAKTLALVATLCVPAAGAAREADDLSAHRAIVQYVAIRTFLPEKLCESASPDVRADVAAVVGHFRSRFADLVRLAESSPLFADANRPNEQTVTEFETRSLGEYDATCRELQKEIAIDLNGDQSYFDKWTRELRRPVKISTSPPPEANKLR